VVYAGLLLGGLVLGLVVGRWWTLTAAVAVAFWIAVTTGVDEVPPWFLGAAYAGLLAATIAVGVFIRQRAGESLPRDEPRESATDSTR
jgi:hypothetical protein